MRSSQYLDSANYTLIFKFENRIDRLQIWRPIHESEAFRWEPLLIANSSLVFFVDASDCYATVACVVSLLSSLQKVRPLN